MKTELLTVSRIFTESLYRIPDYQRGYSWEEEQLSDFWLDIEQLNEESKHYMGVLTLEEVAEKKWNTWDDDIWIIKPKNYKPFYIVDGQQRLTTVVILLESIIETAKTQHINYTEIETIRKKYIFDSKPENHSGSYIFGYEKDNPSYEYLKVYILNQESGIHHPKEETIYTKNLLQAKTFFLEKIKDYKDSDIEMLFKKITQQIVFNAYEISSDIDVFVTFETMNNRGKSLSTLELLKNRLIYISTKLPENETEVNRLRKHINDAWKSAYHYLGKSKERRLNDDKFLKTFIMKYYLENIDDKQTEKNDDKYFHRFDFRMRSYDRFLLNELFPPKRLNSNDQTSGLPLLDRNYLYEFSHQLKYSVQLYYELSDPFDSNFSSEEKIWIERYGRINGYEPSCVLFTLFQNEKDETKRIEVIKALEKYDFIKSISFNSFFYRGNRNDLLINFGLRKITSDELLSQIKARTNEFLKENSISDLLLDFVRKGNGYYGWNFIQYFLFEYENSLKKSSKSDRSKINWFEFSKENYTHDYLTIEHIYPQKAKDRYWTDRFSKYTTTQKKYLRNSLGNLLALSRPKNASLSNKSFDAKKTAETTGYCFGSYSENEVGLYTEWTSKEILARGLKMLEFMEKYWDIKIGDHREKIKALGLDFLGKKDG
jgi:uncharacterized protein with ParB-like and HNH nuclease domain